MTIKNVIKRTFITIAIIFGLVLLTAILIPIFFKDKIFAVVKKEMNDNLNANSDFKDINLSLFRHFPNLTVSIENLQIIGKDSFSSDTLISAKSIDVSVDIIAAIGGKYEILNIGLITPRIHAIVHANGAANWNITKPDTTKKATTPTETKPFELKLRKYEIENAYIEYRDEQGKMATVIENLSHKGSGDFTSEVFTLKTQTTIDAFTFIMGNVPYMSKVNTKIDMDLDINSKTSKYSFNTEKVQLNGLKLTTKGFVQMPDTTNMIMDIQFNTPSNDFKDILSLVPGMYQNSFKDIKTSGKLTLNGFVKGIYNKKQMPAFSFNLGIQDASFQFPLLPQKVSDIQVKLAIDNPDGVIDHTVVNLEKAHLVFGSEPFDFRLVIKNPISNQLIDASAKGKVDLSQVKTFVKLDDGTKMAGIISANVTIKGSGAAAQKKEFDKIDASGTIQMDNLVYASKDYPGGVNINSLLLTFNPKNVSVTNLKGEFNDTKFSGDGSINNMLGYYLHNEALEGVFHFNADKIDANKWMGTSSTTTKDTSKPATAPFAVPNNLNISFVAEVGTIIYDKLNMTNIKGGLSIKDEAAILENISANALDGTIKMSGFYSTKINKMKPDIKFDYSLQSVDIQKMYSSFSMVQKMMPAAKYVNGKLNTELGFTAKLKPDMTPDMNSLTGKGNLLILNGNLSNFPITDQLADKLKLSQFKTITLNDTKIFFSFENGRVTVQPYKMKMNGIDAEIAGSHGFDQTIDYGINMAVPKTILGGESSGIINNLVSQATSKGIPLQVGNTINLSAKIGGTVTKPTVETGLKNAAGNAVDDVKKKVEAEVQKKIDSVKTVVKDTVAAIKKQAVNAAKEEVKKQILGGGDSTKNKAINNAANEAKKGLNDLFKKKK